MSELHLTLKAKWFDMILSGKKKEEYREVKDYWIKRLAGIKGCGTGYNFALLCSVANKCKQFDHIVFKNGYAKDARMMKIECKGINVDEGKKQWGAILKQRVFVIKLGKIIETRNCGVEEKIKTTSDKLSNEATLQKLNLPHVSTRICPKAAQCANVSGGLICPKDVICPI